MHASKHLISFTIVSYIALLLQISCNSVHKIKRGNEEYVRQNNHPKMSENNQRPKWVFNTARNLAPGGGLQLQLPLIQKCILVQRKWTSH